MQVLVDTSIWSLALRRRKTEQSAAEIALVAALRDLIGDGRALLLGAVRQELLSGIKSAAQFGALRDALMAFPDLEISTTDYVRAAECFNLCRARGVQGANTDFLLCAVSLERRLPIFTRDQDFAHFQSLLPLTRFTGHAP